MPEPLGAARSPARLCRVGGDSIASPCEAASVSAPDADERSDSPPSAPAPRSRASKDMASACDADRPCLASSCDGRGAVDALAALPRMPAGATESRDSDARLALCDLLEARRSEARRPASSCASRRRSSCCTKTKSPSEGDGCDGDTRSDCCSRSGAALEPSDSSPRGWGECTALASSMPKPGVSLLDARVSDSRTTSASSSALRRALSPRLEARLEARWLDWRRLACRWLGCRPRAGSSFSPARASWPPAASLPSDMWPANLTSSGDHE